MSPGKGGLVEDIRYLPVSYKADTFCSAFSKCDVCVIYGILQWELLFQHKGQLVKVICQLHINHGVIAMCNVPVYHAVFVRRAKRGPPGISDDIWGEKYISYSCGGGVVAAMP